VENYRITLVFTDTMVVIHQTLISGCGREQVTIETSRFTIQSSVALLPDGLLWDQTTANGQKRVPTNLNPFHLFSDHG